MIMIGSDSAIGSAIMNRRRSRVLKDEKLNINDSNAVQGEPCGEGEWENWQKTSPKLAIESDHGALIIADRRYREL